MTGTALLWLVVSAPSLEPGPPTRGITGAALPDESGLPSSSEPSPAAGPLASDAARDALAHRLDAVLDGLQWPRARWSVLALSLDRGDTLYARDPHAPMTPASNVKLLTSAAALHYLGPDFRFQTFVLARGELASDGILRGDVILYGTGDPTVSDRLYPTKTAVLDTLARELSAAGVRGIRGDVVGDGTFFPDGTLPPGWDHTDLNDWFAAPVSALSYNENVVTLRIEPGPFSGIRPVVHTIPEGAPVHFLNEATTVRNRAWPPLMISRPHPHEPISLVGQMRVGQRDAWRVITVDDPVLFAADAFRKALIRAGIQVKGDARGLAEDEPSELTGKGLWAPAIRPEPHPRVLARHLSPPLFQLLQVMNKESHNLYAELLLKTVGQVAEGDPTWAGGIRAVGRYLRTRAGVTPSLFHLEDGSGLAPGNRVSASAFVRVLEQVAREGWGEHFWEALPLAGVRRELPRMYRTPAARNLRAKTGTIEHVSALSGIVRSLEGERILFSILSNDVPSTGAAKRVEDRIGAELAALDRPFRPSGAATTAGRDPVEGRPPM